MPFSFTDLSPPRRSSVCQIVPPAISNRRKTPRKNGESESVDEAGSPEVNDACIECVKRHMFRNAMIILVLTNWVKSNKKRKFWSLVVYWRTFELHHNWKKIRVGGIKGDIIQVERGWSVPRCHVCSKKQVINLFHLYICILSEKNTKKPHNLGVSLTARVGHFQKYCRTFLHNYLNDSLHFHFLNFANATNAVYFSGRIDQCSLVWFSSEVLHSIINSFQHLLYLRRCLVFNSWSFVNFYKRQKIHTTFINWSDK